MIKMKDSWYRNEDLENIGLQNRDDSLLIRFVIARLHVNPGDTEEYRMRINSRLEWKMSLRSVAAVGFDSLAMTKEESKDFNRKSQIRNRKFPFHLLHKLINSKRLRTPAFRRMWRMCVFIVVRETPRVSAMRAAELPSMIKSPTSLSRLESSIFFANSLKDADFLISRFCRFVVRRR